MIKEDRPVHKCGTSRQKPVMCNKHGIEVGYRETIEEVGAGVEARGGAPRPTCHMTFQVACAL